MFKFFLINWTFSTLHLKIKLQKDLKRKLFILFSQYLCLIWDSKNLPTLYFPKSEIIWHGQMDGFMEHSVSEISDLIFSTVYIQKFYLFDGPSNPISPWYIYAKSIEKQQKTLFKVFSLSKIYPLQLCMDLENFPYEGNVILNWIPKSYCG